MTRARSWDPERRRRDDAARSFTRDEHSRQMSRDLRASAQRERNVSGILNIMGMELRHQPNLKALAVGATPSDHRIFGMPVITNDLIPQGQAIITNGKVGIHPTDLNNLTALVSGVRASRKGVDDMQSAMLEVSRLLRTTPGQIAAIIEGLTTKAQQAMASAEDLRQALSQGLITVNEARAAASLEPLADGGEIRDRTKPKAVRPPAKLA